jgi:hypothetical protein
LSSRFPFIVPKHQPAINISAVVDLIVQTQLPSGQIPWSRGDKTDPWDHVEAAMGLTIGGRWQEARKAFQWLQDAQLADGSWFAAYENGTVKDRIRESNHAAYIAAGLYHYLLVTQDTAFIHRMWPTLEAAVDFCIGLQAPGGEIHWAINAQGQPDPMALLTGCSSITFSLKCAIALARTMGQDRPRWQHALKRLLDCIRNKPQHFNMTKSRFSMDWFYPILCGALTGDAAKVRLDKFWKKFVVQNMGVRCVSDQPWVTIAESSELVLALSAMGNNLLARIVFSWICDDTFEDGTYWCGFTFSDMVLWPEEKITWTNAVVLMAADALYGLTPAARMFDHGHWDALGVGSIGV